MFLRNSNKNLRRRYKKNVLVEFGLLFLLLLLHFLFNVKTLFLSRYNYKKYHVIYKLYNNWDTY